MVPRHPGRPLTHPGPLLVRRPRNRRLHDHLPPGVRLRAAGPRRARAWPRWRGVQQRRAQAGLVLRASQRFAVAGHATTATVTLGPGRVARSAGLVEVVEEKLDSLGGVATKDLLHKVRIALAEGNQQVAVVLDPAQARLRVLKQGFH